MAEILHSASWSSPSNIALIKYWGKHGLQMPSNPSISFTLSRCKTETTVEVLPAGDGPLVEVFLDDEKKDSFVPKIEKFLGHLAEDMEWLEDHRFRIRTHNTFPHSSGIASSASGMSALALAFCSLHEEIDGSQYTDFYRRASRYARIGSGSACRSVYGGLVSWGKYAGIGGSSQEFATPIKGTVNPVFANFHDCILLVDAGAKNVSSTVGHDLMRNHPFASQRFEEAVKNMDRLLPALESGDLETFIRIVEGEALMLHGLMMSSQPYFILIKPNTLEILNRIWLRRAETNDPVMFTLDAGANVHLLYPRSIKEKTEAWIASELSPFCENNLYICDEVGSGPQRLNP